jgi:hypothetical protein
LPARFTGDA